ncbi:MAG: tetratricopeptide repeat protein [Desulfobacterales bacterium]|nr:tetratricopeptide repeat protein [Desulfobacterales bacterium]
MSKNSKKQSDNVEDRQPPADKVPLAFYVQWPIIQLSRTVGEIVDSYKKIFKIAPTDLKSMYLKKSRAADRAGDTRRSLFFMEKVASLDPKDPDALYQLGIAYEKNKALDEAIRAYQRVIEIKSDHAKAHYRTGVIHLRKKAPEQAVKALEAALKIEPESVELNFRLGQANDRLQEYEKAISFFSRAVEINPDFLRVYKNMALTYDSMGKHKEALECLKRALELEEMSG